MRENKQKHSQEHPGNKSANRTIGVLVAAAVLLLSCLLMLVACNNAAKPAVQEAAMNTESLSDTPAPLEEEVQQQEQQKQQKQQQYEYYQAPSPESFGSPLKGTRFEGLPPTTMDEMPEGDDPDAFALWLAALDDQEFCDNLALISNGKVVASDMENFRTRSRPGVSLEETAFYLKSITLFCQANDRGRTPSRIEAEYIAAMQMYYFGEASPWPSLAEEDEVALSSSAQTEDTINTLSSSGGNSGPFTGPSVGTYPLQSKGGTFQKGLILVTNDPAGGSLPTGHAAILYSELDNTAMTSFPELASRNDPQEEGVQTEPNDWHSSHQTCFVLESNVTTAAESAAVADWCYDDERNSAFFNPFFDSPWRTDGYYCSQLVWAGFLDLYDVSIGNADSIFSVWGNAVHPMELKRADETTLLYQHGTVDTGWVEIDNTAWYYVDDTGQHSIGWRQIEGSWHYFDSLGVMQTGWQQIEGSWYYLNSDGVMQTGWQVIGGDTYYFGTDGAMKIGWQTIEGDTYYFNSDGVMLTGWQTIGGTTYYFDANGELDSSGSSGSLLLFGSTITPINDNLTAIAGQPFLIGGTPNFDGSPANFVANLILNPAYSSSGPVFGVDWDVAYMLNPFSDPVATVNKRTGLLTPTAAGTVIVDCYLINGPIIQSYDVPPTNAMADPVQITVTITPGYLYGAQGNTQTVQMNTINGEAFTDFLITWDGDSTYGYQNYLEPLTPMYDYLSFNFTMAAGIGNWPNVDNFATFVAANAGDIQLFAADANGEPLFAFGVLEADNDGMLFFDLAPDQAKTVTLNIEIDDAIMPPGSYVLRFTHDFSGDDDGAEAFLGVNVDFMFSI